MAFSNTVHVNQKGELIHRQISEQNLQEGWIFDNLLQRRCAVPRDFIFLKSHYLQTAGYDPNIPVYEDWDLKLRLARIAKYVYTHEDGVAYRQTDAGLSSVSIMKHVKWKNHVRKKS